jgi:hypothetical protein
MHPPRQPQTGRTFVAAAGLAGALALPAAVAGEEEIRLADPAAHGLAERLGAVANGLDQVTGRLDRIDAVLVAPPDPDRPAIRDALAAIKREAEGIAATADDMLRRI